MGKFLHFADVQVAKNYEILLTVNTTGYRNDTQLIMKPPKNSEGDKMIVNKKKTIPALSVLDQVSKISH